MPRKKVVVVDETRNIALALKELCEEKGLPKSVVIDAMGEALKKAIEESIKAKKENLVGNMASQGTTPRQLTDLIGSLCDLTSGSGDKGTPIILVQGYFDNYTN